MKTFQFHLIPRDSEYIIEITAGSIGKLHVTDKNGNISFAEFDEPYLFDSYLEAKAIRELVIRKIYKEE